MLCAELASVSSAGAKCLSASVVFGAREWEEEVWRYAPHAVPRAQAERARRQVDAGDRRLTWRPCESEGSKGTRLPGCRKIYVPLDRAGASAAPFGLVFQLVKTPDGLVWNFIALGSATQRTRGRAPFTSAPTSACTEGTPRN